MLIFESGLAVSETAQSRLPVLWSRMIDEYKVRLDNFDPCSDESNEIFSGKSYCFHLRDPFVELFKRSIRLFDSDGKKTWDAFNNTKSELVNHWMPHFKMDSGWDLDDAVEHVRKHGWVYCANRNIKKIIERL